MGQAKRRGTPEDRAALAIAWDEAHREDKRRFPPPPVPMRRNHGKAWLALAASLSLTLPLKR